MLMPPLTAQEVVAAARKTYDGPLIAGEDLMAFSIGRGGVAVGAGAAGRGCADER